MEKTISTRIKMDTEAPTAEPERQFYFMEQAKKLVAKREHSLGRRLSYYVETFGCQMNARDSEKLRGILDTIGFVQAGSEEADFVIYNTCTVRENANNKVYGRLGTLGSNKKKRPGMMIALCGCMMQETHVVEKLRTGYRFVNLIFGTHNIFKFAELTVRAMLEAWGESGCETVLRTRPVIDIWKDTTEIVEDLPVQRKYHFKSGVNIMFGCNNFCSYCIVPYVRGRERSRAPEDIIREIERLVADGVVEVMLLGQNVNSYGKNLVLSDNDGSDSADAAVNFAELLRRVENIEGLERIRFMTSHPKDLSDELIEVMARSKKICRHMHLPLQSGSSRVLEKMNRHYTKEQYLELVEKLRAAIPDIAITTDIIVGFPGETKEDFLETLDVVRKVRYDSAFTFIYSRRSGTPAAEMEDQVPEAEVKENFDLLLSEVQRIAAEKAKELEGAVLPVLVEQVNEHESTLLTGRLSNNLVVHFSCATEPGTARLTRADESLIGKIVDVKLTECKGFYYYGEMAEPSEPQYAQPRTQK